jgi:dienelactone hydrolase
MEIPVEKAGIKDDPQVLSAPQITQPLYGCAKAVNITGYTPGATLDLEVDGVVAPANVPGHSPAPFGALIKLPTPFKTNQTPAQKVRARQHFGGATSPWTAVVTVRDHTADYPAGLPRPELFNLPLYKCGVRTGLANLIVGCDVQILVEGNPDGTVQGANDPQGINLTTAYGNGQHVRAKATLCGDPSPLAAEQVTQTATPPLPAPTFGTFVEGGGDLTIQGLADGAQFELTRNGTSLGKSACWGGSFVWSGINPPFKGPGLDTFKAIQQLCPSDPPSPAGTGTPIACSALKPPTFGPVQDGDTAVTFTDFIPGSRIKVFVNGIKEGDGSGPVVVLSKPIPHNAKVDAWQSVGTCVGKTVEQVTSMCVAPPLAGDPSALDLFPVGTHEYNGPMTVSFDGYTYHIHGDIYYPAEDDGADQPFNQRLAKLGRVPLVVLVHGRHGTANSYQGYVYLQQQLARMGFVAASIDESETDGGNDGNDFTGNIVRRGELGLANIAFLQTLDPADPIFKGVIDFSRVGLMGHSRGGEAVLVMMERNNLPGVKIPGVISLAPVDAGATSGHPKGIAFMTILPAGDGDVVANNGAEFYDQADPAPFKTQLYVDQANHNYFNRNWLNDDSMGLVPLMARADHERILSAYGCAFFRRILLGQATSAYLDHSVLPAGVMNQNIHMSYEEANTRIVDNYESHPITSDNEGQATAQQGLLAADYPFAQAPGAFNSSFFGDTTGNVLQQRENTGSFREPLKSAADLTSLDVRVRAAEVYQAPTIPPTPTGFRIGLEDTQGIVVWLDVDDVGGLSRPFNRHALDTAEGNGDLTKTMLSTYRFPGHCFVDPNGKFQVGKVQAIRLGLNRNDKRPIAFDDVEIVKP